MTVIPQYSTDQGGWLYSEFRQRRETGEISIDGSITRVDDTRGTRVGGEELRGHIRADAAFRANDDITWGANIFRASDDTYPNLYKIPDYVSRNVQIGRAHV